MSFHDCDGQPHPVYNLRHRRTRDTNELLGVLRGVLADGHLSDQEITFVASWLLTNEEFAGQWPFDRLLERISAAIADEQIDENERTELHALMEEILGHPSPEYFTNAPTSFPLTRPEPELVFDSNEFVLTGKFVYGTRRECESEILVRGGSCCDRVTLRTSYLVIGSMSSRDWVHTNWGRKIELAAKYAESHPIAIISEKRWVDYLLPEARSATA